MRTTGLRGAAVAFAAGLMIHCGDSAAACNDGGEGCECAADTMCLSGLKCFSGLCVQPSATTTDPTSDPPPTTTAPDATTEAATTDPNPTAPTTGAPPATTTGPQTQCGDAVIEGDETCEDGNQVNLDACDNACHITPEAITIGPASDTVFMGMAEGTAFSNLCPPGQVVAGVTFGLGVGTLVAQLRAPCAEIKLGKLADQAFTVDLVASDAWLPWIGTEEVTKEETRLCPAGHALVSLVGFPWGNNYNNFQALRLNCAPLTIEKVDGQYTLALGTPVPQPILGSLDVEAYQLHPTCPEGYVAAGLSGYGSYIPHALGLSCAELELTFP